MLTITADAATAIKEIVDTSPVEGGGLRIFAQPQDDTQASLEIALAEEPGPGDEVMDAEGASVYVERNAAAYLEDKQLDASVEGDQVRFSVTERPPAV